ncbi:MAG TPA: hypothetical protein VJ276_06550 [Thermoanaerobaculia bacterium]|nr:hypothetical protein [Thermoanaerobaculia bacterium]
MRKALVGILAVLVICSLWRLWPEADAADDLPLAPTPVVAPPPEVTPVAWHEARPHSGAIGRNVFTYGERASRPPAAARPAPPEVIAPPMITAERDAPRPAGETPARPLFPYTYIGRFGPDANPIAVFSGNGEIINARVGEVIAGAWTLREIGIESVVLNDQRVAISSSAP